MPGRRVKIERSCYAYMIFNVGCLYGGIIPGMLGYGFVGTIVAGLSFLCR